MKNYCEIVKELNKAKARAEKAKTACEQIGDELSAHFDKIRNGGGRFATSEAWKEERARIDERLKAEAEKETRARIEAAILKDNAAQALFAENIGKICEIWNSYAGKVHGEKTRDKIRAEIETATGLRVWVVNDYSGAKISINTTARGSFFYGYGDTLTAYATETQTTDGGNKIQPLRAEAFRLSYIGAYVDDVKKHAAALVKAHAAAMKAEQEFKNACENYNALTRGKINRANPREGVKKWFF